MDLLSLLVLLLVFACVCWGAFYICDRSGFPPPVKWIVGAILLIILLAFALGQFAGGAFLHRPILR